MTAQADAGLVMPTHLYGQLADYGRTQEYAARNGWFLLENDTLCAARVTSRHQAAFGQALLTSFGYAKTFKCDPWQAGS